MNDGKSWFAADQVVVKFKSNVAEDAVQSFLRSNGLVQRSHIRAIGWRLLTIPGPLNATWWVNLLNNSPLVERAEVNGIVTTGNSPVYDDKYAPYQWNLRKIGMEAAWDRTRGGTYATAVIDTGISTYHWRELVPNIMRNSDGALMGANFTGSSSSTGYIAEDDSTQNDGTLLGHGTFVSGIIGATATFSYNPNTNADSGIAGVNPYGKILPLKILDYSGTDPETRNNPNGTTYHFAVAVLEAASTYGVRVINASVQGYPVPAYDQSGSQAPNDGASYGYSQALLDSIKSANDNKLLFVSIMGNYVSNPYFPSDNVNKISYPGAYWRTMAVGATDMYDGVAPYSRRGSHISVVAPGTNIYSTFRAYPYWGTDSGTSYATPHVAGLAGLLLQEFPSMLPNDLRYRIEDTSDSSSSQIPPFSNYYGWGRINADTATQFMSYSQTFLQTVGQSITQQQFVSIPVWPLGLPPEDTTANRAVDVATVFPGANAQVAWYDPETSQYLPYSNFKVPRFGPGRAYLVTLYSQANASFNAATYPFRKPGHLFSVHLKPGLNGVAVPGAYAITWNPDTWYVRTNLENPYDQSRNGTEDKRTLRAAATAGWIDPVMHRFEPNTPQGGDYFPAINNGDLMAVGKGYMIRVYRECDILIPSY